MKLHPILLTDSGYLSRVRKMVVSRAFLGLILLGGVLSADLAEALCYTGPGWKDRGSPYLTSGMGISNVSVISNYLQPMGSIIAVSTVVPHQSFAGEQAGSPNDVLYWCETKEDADKVVTVFATNGDSDTQGMYEVPGYPGAYYTGFKNVASRITVADTGQVVGKKWKEFPLTPIYNPDNGRYEILFKQLSPLRLELIKVPSVPPTGFVSENDGYPYPAAGEPFMYYAFSMPGIYEGTGPQPGEDSQFSYTGWPYHFLGFGINNKPTAYLFRRAGCVVRNNTPHVLFPTVSVTDLEQGASVQAPVRVDVECDSGVISGTELGSTALGLQVSSEAYAKAKTIPGLVNSAGGVSHLLPDGYGNDSTVATGVGIRLEHAATGERIPFLGWYGVNCTMNHSGVDPETCGDNPLGGGKSAGWMPVLEGADTIMTTEFQTTKYSQQFTVILEKLPNATVTPGKIKARAQVLVKIQ